MGLGSIELSQDSDLWRPLVSTTMNHRFWSNIGEFLSSCTTIDISKSAQLHGVCYFLMLHNCMYHDVYLLCYGLFNDAVASVGCLIPYDTLNNELGSCCRLIWRAVYEAGGLITLPRLTVKCRRCVCGQLVRVLRYRSRCSVRFPAVLDLLSSGSGREYTQPRKYNWGATRKKK
jgi:hypothetical protein